MIIRYENFITEKWTNGMFQDGSHPIDDEDVKNIFCDYLDHFSLHRGFEIIKQFNGYGLSKYVFTGQDHYNELLVKEHFLVIIKLDQKMLSDEHLLAGNQYWSYDQVKRVSIDKYVTKASDLILDISNRMEDLGYYLKYPDIKIFFDSGRRVNGEYTPDEYELVFRFTKIKD